MKNYKTLALASIVLFIVTGLFYREATAQIPIEEASKIEKYESKLKIGNYKVTAVLNSLGEAKDSWSNNINNSSYYVSEGQLVRIDAHSTGTSILFLENNTYLLDSYNRTYNQYTNKNLYPEIALDLKENTPEILQIYTIFLKDIKWIEQADNSWESVEPVIVSNNGEVNMLKMWVYLSETNYLMERLVIIDEDAKKHTVNLKYEIISNEEIAEALNFSTYTALSL